VLLAFSLERFLLDVSSEGSADVVARTDDDSVERIVGRSSKADPCFLIAEPLY
jgi:hypothetical protein